MRGVRLIGVACAVSVVMTGVPTSVLAAAPPDSSGDARTETGASGTGPGGTNVEARSEAAADSPTSAADVDEALERGDLQTALERARARRKAAPSPESWAVEGAVLEKQGDHAGALVAYRDALAAAEVDPPTDPALVADIEAKIEAIEERSRGAVADEPESTHRETIDAARAARIEAARPAPPPPVVSAPPPRADRVVDKWYFWVTLGAIVATAGVITGIAIKSGLDEQGDALDRASRLGPPPMGGAGGPALLRF